MLFCLAGVKYFSGYCGGVWKMNVLAKDRNLPNVCIKTFKNGGNKLNGTFFRRKNNE